jgi:hypothetical protein
VSFLHRESNGRRDYEGLLAGRSIIVMGSQQIGASDFILLFIRRKAQIHSLDFFIKAEKQII